MNLDKYVALKNIYETFSVTTPTVNKHLKELGIEPVKHNRANYVRKEEYAKLVNKLELSARVHKIAELDAAAQEEASHKEQMYQEKIKNLEDKVNTLEKNLEAREGEIFSFHQILKTKESSIEALNDKVALITENATKEINERDKIITDMKIEISEKDIALEEERNSKEILIKELDEYKNRSFMQRLKAVFVK